MEVERLRSFFRRHRRIALDTCVFIYHLESNPKYLECTDFIFPRIERSESKASTSTITMTELLVLPYRERDQKQADEIYGLLSTYPNLEWIAPTLEVAELAARLRALHRLQTPDALQAATALHSQATGLITNDAAFERVPGFQTLVLEKLR